MRHTRAIGVMIARGLGGAGLGGTGVGHHAVFKGCPAELPRTQTQGWDPVPTWRVLSPNAARGRAKAISLEQPLFWLGQIPQGEWTHLLGYAWVPACLLTACGPLPACTSSTGGQMAISPQEAADFPQHASRNSSHSGGAL